MLQLFYKNTFGITKFVEVKDNITFGEFKKLLSEREGIPVEKMRLLYQGRSYPDTVIMAERQVTRDSTIHMFVKTDNFCLKCSLENSFNVKKR